MLKKSPKIMITINKNPLQVVVPKERYQQSYNNLGQNKYIADIITQQPIHPSHTCQPFGQSKGAPCI